MNLFSEVEHLAVTAEHDIRHVLPNLMKELGVNVSNEREAIHAAIIWLVSELAKVAGSQATANDIAKVL